MASSIMLQKIVSISGNIVDGLIQQPDTRYTADWFDSLPALVDAWCQRWKIRLAPVLPRLSYNIVLFGMSEIDGPVVLKLAPSSEEFAAEIAGLKAMQGPYMVRLLDFDPHAAGMLLTRVQPGVALCDLDDRFSDAEGTRIAAESLLHIWTPPPAASGDLIPLERWFRDLYRYDEALRNGRPEDSLPRSVIAKRLDAARTLLNSGDPVVLHGDLHHENILTNLDGGWTTIDPKGLIGDRSYDTGTWMLNPPPRSEKSDLANSIDGRLDIFTDVLGIDRSRVIAGALVHCTLSACWALMDPTSGQHTEDEWLARSIDVAMVLADLYEGL